MDSKADIAIVGGGLSGGLIALRFATVKPDLEIALIETGSSIGGHHTWSFHETDISPEALEWLRPMITCSWDETTVQFPRHSRTIPGKYHSIRSEDFNRVLTEKLGSAIRLNSKVARLSESHVELTNGDIIAARLVIDARGALQLPNAPLAGFQKFIGIDFELEEPHGLKSPILMDATCPQLDGYRFFYLLPFSDRKLLVEETYYSDTPELNHDRITRSIRSYVERRGWKIKNQEREERGVLAIPMTSDYIVNSLGGEPLPVGLRGGYFHATTGYSFPDAVRNAEFLANIEDVTTANARTGLMKFRRGFISRQRFYRLLNRLLFQASEPSLRYHVFQQFYEQPQELIQRFYSGKTTWGDRLRILSGRPPVPLERALKSLSERSLIARANEAKEAPTNGEPA